MSTKKSYPSEELQPSSPIDASPHMEVPDVPHIICDFLKWVEHEKGLALCEPYKPQYEWYIPIAYHLKGLVMEFLSEKAQPLLSQPEI